MSAESISFLTIESVLQLHRIAIEDQGGDPSILNQGLLETAIAMPMQRFGGEYLHPDIPAMAAAYAFHICKNHPFADGNKRAALGSMLAFLVINGWTLDISNENAANQILRLAAGQVDKSGLTEWVRTSTKSIPAA